MRLPSLSLRCLFLVALAAIGGVALALIALAAEPLGSNFLYASLVLLLAVALAAYGAFHAWIRHPLLQLRALLHQVETHGPQLQDLPAIGGATEFRQLARQLTGLLSEHNRLFDNLAGRALTDPVTGLPNRPRFMEFLRRAVDKAQTAFQPFVLLLMDLDRFKDINDTLGHHVGDKLLREIGQRLQMRLRESDRVARIGGDEFAILISGIKASDALVAGRMLLQSLHTPFEVDAHRLDVAASVGVVAYPDHGVDAATLIMRADIAMYHAKEKTRGCVLYEDGMDPHNAARLLLLGQLRHALEREEFILVFQPKVGLRDNAVTGVEALARWQHPSGSLYLPDTFIPLLERSGLIRHLTEWLLHEAFAFCQHLRQAGYSLTVSVNLSVRDLQDAHFLDIVSEQLATNRVDPKSIVFEITESAVMTDPQHAIEVLRRLAEMGFTLSIDDFGTGYSSLVYLKKLPVGEVKIDKTFVLNMSNDANDAAIVRTSIELARNLGLGVVAEGVENGEILEGLRQLGCDAVQGMYISRPLTVAELEQWLVKSAWARVADEQVAAEASTPPLRTWH